MSNSREKNIVFDYGDWVRCNGKIMCVMDSEENDTNAGQIGLMKENAPVVFNEEEAIASPEIVYYPISDIEKLPEVDVCESVLRTLFRLETSVWKLCEQGLYPFSDKSGTFTLTEDDLKVFATNLPKADAIMMDNWTMQFTAGYHVTHVHCPADDGGQLSLSLVWSVLRDIFGWFDIEEDDLENVTDIINCYFASKGKSLLEIEVPDLLKTQIICGIEEHSKKNEISEEQRQIYISFLDNLCRKNDHWALEHKAYAYYGGNGVVPCDWNIAEQTLLKLEKAGNSSASNSLGYIYYSDRLGEPDYDKAFYFFSKAAKKGIVEARYKLCDMIRKGHGTEKDPDKAFKMLQKVYNEQLASIQDGFFSCKYADVALRMGYCYENGAGCEQNFHLAHEYYIRAKYAIDMRVLRGGSFGDDVVKKNIEKALESIRDKDTSSDFCIVDLPGFKGTEYIDLVEEKKAALLSKVEQLYNCDFFSDDFDPDGHEYHLDLVSKVIGEYSFKDFYCASFDWLRSNCKTPDQYINFANLYFYYGGTDFFVANPYPFLAYLYNGIDWEDDAENAEKAYNIFESIAVNMLQQADIYRGYADEYDPFKDKRLTKERARIAHD